MKRLTLLLIVSALPHLAWGQLDFRAVLSGSNEVPPRATPAFGAAFATLDPTTNLFEFNYSFQDLLSEQTGAHIHLGAIGVNGPVIYPLPMGSPASLSIVLTPEDVANLQAGLWYVNVHSTTYRGGEIRGQLLPVPEPSTYAAGAAALLLAAILGRRRLAQLRHAA